MFPPFIPGSQTNSGPNVKHFLLHYALLEHHSDYSGCLCTGGRVHPSLLVPPSVSPGVKGLNGLSESC